MIVPLRPSSKVTTLSMRYTYVTQFVDAFQLVAGQNPDTKTHAQTGQISWTRTHSEAITLAKAKRPGLILADIQLADGSSGLDAVNELWVRRDWMPPELDVWRLK